MWVNIFCCSLICILHFDFVICDLLLFPLFAVCCRCHFFSTSTAFVAEGGGGFGLSFYDEERTAALVYVRLWTSFPLNVSLCVCESDVKSVLCSVLVWVEVGNGGRFSPVFMLLVLCLYNSSPRIAQARRRSCFTCSRFSLQMKNRAPNCAVHAYCQQQFNKPTNLVTLSLSALCSVLYWQATQKNGAYHLTRASSLRLLRPIKWQDQQAECLSCFFYFI